MVGKLGQNNIFGREEREGTSLDLKTGRAKLAPLLFFLFALPARFPLFAQSRDIPIFVPAPEGGTDEQREYFSDNFKMELGGAKYPVVDSIDKAVFSLPLTISDNPYFGGEGEEQFILTIALVRTKDNTEIVRFEFPFTDLQKMYDWNLFLVYRTMGNAAADDEGGAAAAPAPAPAPEQRPPPPRDLWRDKWLYASFGAGADLGYFLGAEDRKLKTGMVMPCASAGVEFQFLDFLGAELGVRARLIGHGNSLYGALGVPVTIRGIFKFSAVMFEPYAGAEYGAAFGGAETPLLSALGGAQLSFKCGERSAWALDIRVSLGVLGRLQFPGENPYNLARVTVSGGWKIGWFDRPAPRPRG
ncbi:MAG: hypothetical protein Pg6C_11980 [Treponemataceae bacterium]|nr:MAG: hypothetical protein Pg6C_11980 [Treponemataceae bacterium]